MNTPMSRHEYPRPRFVRKDRMNLNGSWEHQTDRGHSGEGRGYANRYGVPFAETITVPFCRERELSGISDQDFCPHVLRGDPRAHPHIMGIAKVNSKKRGKYG